MGVFSYTLFLVKHEKGRMPKLVLFIYSRVDPWSLCWGLHVAPSCWAPRGTLHILSLRHKGGLNSNWLIGAHALR